MLPPSLANNKRLTYQIIGVYMINKINKHYFLSFFYCRVKKKKKSLTCAAKCGCKGVTNIFYFMNYMNTI